jgi:hypothetical protein
VTSILLQLLLFIRFIIAKGQYLVKVDESACQLSGWAA